jgi:hypothetical protein
LGWRPHVEVAPTCKVDWYLSNREWSGPLRIQ